MYRLVLVGLAIVAVSDAAPGRASQDGDLRPLVITGARLVDPAREGVTIVIEGDRITAVGGDGQVTVPPAAQVVEGKGKTVLPGLIDTHVHFRDYVPELFLAHGVTTVRDAGNPPEWILPLKQKQASGEMRGPRMFAVGNILDAPPALRGHHIAVGTPEAARAAARRLLAMGVDGIKVYDKITPELLRPIAEEAHAANRRVIGHINFSAREAALAGIDALEHASGVAIAIAADPAPARDPQNRGVFGWRYRDPANVERLIRLLVERRVAVVPALASWGRGSALRPEFQAEAAKVIANPELAYLPDDAKSRVKNYSGPQWSQAERRAYEADYRALKEFLNRFSRAGGTIVAGTDGGVLAGLSVHHEMRLLVEIGLQPLQAIKAATADAAELIQAGDLGSIAPGKIADVIVVDGNPLQSIDDTKKIALVIQRGRIIDTRYHHGYRIPIPRPPVRTSIGNW